MENETITPESALQEYRRAWAAKERAESDIAAGCAHELSAFTASSSIALGRARARMSALEPYLALKGGPISRAFSDGVVDSGQASSLTNRYCE